MSTIRASNATNVRLFDGGLVIKQGDSSSSFGFELLDEQKKPIDLTDQEATVYLVHRTEGKWSQKVAIEDGNKVSFTIGDVLYLGRYILEIHAGGYVFPSDRSVVLTLVKSEVTYASEDMAKLKEIDTDIIVDKVVTAKKLASKDELAQAKADVLSEVESKHYLTEHQDISELAKRSELPAPYDDSPLKAQISQISGQIATLEGRVDNDTIYDDSELKKAVSGLESKVDNLPKVDTSKLATKAELADYAKKSDLPKPYNDAPVQEFIAKEPQRRLEIEASMRKEMQASIANLPDKSKFGKNLLKDSRIVYTNSDYPINRYNFVTEPIAGKAYTLIFKGQLGEGKTSWTVWLGNGESGLGTALSLGDGLYRLDIVWPAKKGTKPLELLLFPVPNINSVSTVEWIRLVEGREEDLNWYPNYDEVVDTYTFTKRISQAIAQSGNLLIGSATEKKGANEFLNYINLVSALDAHGAGVYTLSFDIKAAKSGEVRVYAYGKAKYNFRQTVVDVGTDWQRVTLTLTIQKSNADSKETPLAFYGTYGTGVIPTVRRVRLSKGGYESLEWRPSDKELAEIYAKLM